MTRKGHYITALAMGLAGLSYLTGASEASIYIDGISDTVHWVAGVLQHGWYPGPSLVIGLCFFAGCVVGAWAPDWMELAYFFGHERHSMISHRTYTHMPIIWITAFCLAFYFVYNTTGWFFNLAWFALGFSAAGLLHSLIDMLSPTGVPLVHPKKRFAIPVYTTGSPREMYVILPIIGASGAYLFRGTLL